MKEKRKAAPVAGLLHGPAAAGDPAGGGGEEAVGPLRRRQARATKEATGLTPWSSELLRRFLSKANRRENVSTGDETGAFFPGLDVTLRSLTCGPVPPVSDCEVTNFKLGDLSPFSLTVHEF